ncbi:MAG: hypothetical protein QXP98_02110 [Thermoproteus sp.]
MSLNKNIVYLLVLDATSMLLAVLGYLAVLTGYCLAKPQTAIMPYYICTKIHLDLLPPLAIIAGFLHGAAGLSLWVSKIKRGLDPYIWALSAIFTSYLLYLWLS